ncbi:MAG TPA: metalloregulator ArsR/SmtB family transcription factor [Trueperaceae bacterium]|nr:metalloregulator ArsR/SmtB family transcription factor [Trueperaceae bacterium]
MIVSTNVETASVGTGSGDAAEALASAFKALGDATRLRILAALVDGTHCVCEIQDVVDVPGNLLSHHLKVLREAGLIDGERRGRWIDYSLNSSAIELLAAALPPDPARLGLDLSTCVDACARDEA